MLIDLHTHTSKYSTCSKLTPENLVEAALAAGLDGIVITEHNCIWDQEEIDNLRRQYAGIKIFNAIEVTVEEDEHVLVYGILNPNAFYKSMPLRVLAQNVQSENGIMILAHPFRYRDEISEEVFDCNIEGIEAASMNVLAYMKEGYDYIKSRKYLIEVAGSDSHHTASVGVFATAFHREIKNERDLVEAIRSKDFSLHRNLAAINEFNIKLDQKISLVKKLIDKGFTNAEVKEECGASLSFAYGVRNGKDLRYIV